MKKFALCFSGYPRFVSECFPEIKNNILNALEYYDIYASFQWNKKWEYEKIHHQFKNTFQKNELVEFFKLYSEYSLVRIEINNPYNFDMSKYSKTSQEPDMNLTIEECRDIYYRLKCQYQSMYDCIKLINNIEEYDYFIRLRTDLIIKNKIEIDKLSTQNILNQNGHATGHDRNFSDWFFIVPRNCILFYKELSDLENHFKDGIIHMHKLIEKVGKKYNIKNFDFGIDTPSTVKNNLFK